MTDRFEEAVRQAAQGLGDDSGGDVPSYHQAWQRGRRRRIVKQAGVGFAGALLLVAALAVNAGNLPGPISVDTGDVASEAPAPTAVAALPTTPAVAAPNSGVAPTAQPIPTSVPTVDAEDSASSEAAVAEPTTTPPPAATTPPTPTVAAATSPVETLPTATPEPPVAAATTADPTPTVGSGAATTSPAPTAAAGPATSIEASPTPDGLTPDRTPAESATATGPAAVPNITFIGPDQKADAIVLTLGANATEAPCDIDRDGEPDATCRLLPRYACVGDVDVKPGYLPVDFDEDGEFDTCVATETTACDTVGDGFADTPCTIELLPEPPPAVDPGDS